MRNGLFILDFILVMVNKTMMIEPYYSVIIEMMINDFTI